VKWRKEMCTEFEFGNILIGGHLNLKDGGVEV
jgi:hypothetical protein